MKRDKKKLFENGFESRQVGTIFVNCSYRYSYNVPSDRKSDHIADGRKTSRCKTNTFSILSESI